jgi:hypothetical protein
VQIWTVEEGFGIGSEFRQTCCAADHFRVYEVFLHWFNSSSPKWNLNIDGHPCQSEALSRGEQASVPLIRYWLPFPGEDSLDAALHESTGLLRHRVRAHGSSVKEGIHLAGDRRRQSCFQEIKHHEHRLLGVFLADPCFLYNHVYYLFVHGELSARA